MKCPLITKQMLGEGGKGWEDHAGGFTHGSDTAGLYCIWLTRFVLRHGMRFRPTCLWFIVRCMILIGYDGAKEVLKARKQRGAAST